MVRPYKCLQTLTILVLATIYPIFATEQSGPLLSRPSLTLASKAKLLLPRVRTQNIFRPNSMCQELLHKDCATQFLISCRSNLSWNNYCYDTYFQKLSPLKSQGPKSSVQNAPKSAASVHKSRNAAFSFLVALFVNIRLLYQ